MSSLSLPTLPTRPHSCLLPRRSQPRLLSSCSARLCSDVRLSRYVPSARNGDEDLGFAGNTSRRHAKTSSTRKHRSPRRLRPRPETWDGLVYRRDRELEYEPYGSLRPRRRRYVGRNYDCYEDNMYTKRER